MKPFDLEKALAGEPVVTRDEQPVIIAGVNHEAKDLYKIAGWVDGSFAAWCIDGKNYPTGEDPHDLFMATKTVKKEGWVNVYTPDVCHTHVARTSHVYGTEREAKSSIVPLGIYIATVKIEWEEEI